MLLLRLLHLLCVCVVLLLRGCCLDLLYEAVNARQQPTRRRKCFCLGFIFFCSRNSGQRATTTTTKKKIIPLFSKVEQSRGKSFRSNLSLFLFFGWAISVIPYFILEHEVDHQGLPQLPAQIPKRTTPKNQVYNVESPLNWN